MRRAVKKFILKIQAFSLVELMVVVALIGVLVSLAVPRFRTFIARSRMSEAVQNLGNIDRLQKAYNLHYHMFGEDNVWFTGPLIGEGDCSDDARIKNKLGFRVEDCSKLRYFYEAGGAGSDKANSSSQPNMRIYPGCQEKDEWEIHRGATGTGSAKLRHTIDIIESCL